MIRLLVALACLLSLSAPAAAQALRERPPEDEVIYFLLPDRFENADPANDRGGLTGPRETTGFDPTDPGYFQGGDLKGLTRRLDYIQGLGATAIWLGPIYKNKPTQCSTDNPPRCTAGYHGYWVTDFKQVDPHFGTNADLKALVEAVHARGMKIYLDIITNHTADVIKFRECVTGECVYRSRADYPYTRRGGVNGPAINAGFSESLARGADSFARLTDPRWAYTPYVPEAEKGVKNPAWLNDPIFYHNRGDTNWRGESFLIGDFVGLDDLFTENPRVVAGMIDIFGWWIDEFGIDGFRVDTARHVNPEFWQAFLPAMKERAAKRGIPNFHIFAEAAIAGPHEAGLVARVTHVDRFDSALDFPFRFTAIDVASGRTGTDRLKLLLDEDALYRGGAQAALRHPTFLGNHDQGRFGHWLREARPGMTDAEALQRTILAHGLMFFTRGIPTLYAGDEQGFAGDGPDKGARETLFASRTPSYLDNDLIGTDATHATARFDPAHPVYRAIASMAAARAGEPLLRRGRVEPRAWSHESGVFALSRLDDRGREALVVFNTATTAFSGNILVEAGSRRWRALQGACPQESQAPGSVAVSVPALSYIVCVAN
jgi:neopullulanase